MSFAIATRAELLKTKRTASVWLSVLGAGFVPALFFTAYLLKPDDTVEKLRAEPWAVHFMYGWRTLSTFLFPMYVILICSLIPQIEYKNNTWKQVFSAPRSIANIFFSKLAVIHLMILLFFLLFNIFMIAGGVVVNLLNNRFTFLQHPIDWEHLVKLNLKTYISILGISAIQYWLSLRFKSFIAPVGIGLALLIATLVALSFDWEHVSKLPFAHPTLTLFSFVKPGSRFLQNHELNSIGYFIFFTIVGFLDMKLRKEKG